MMWKLRFVEMPDGQRVLQGNEGLGNRWFNIPVVPFEKITNPIDRQKLERVTIVPMPAAYIRACEQVMQRLHDEETAK